jgi:hypothetical protein
MKMFIQILIDRQLIVQTFSTLKVLLLLLIKEQNQLC